MECLKTVLVANRGEIAIRLINAAKKLGIKTIAIYTEPDTSSPHVFLADKAYLLEGAATTAYLDIAQIIAIAKTNSADAVIPGYGFLSENADFARQLKVAGIQFVGPRPETIEELGLKHTARDHAVAAGVPIVPGSDGLIGSESEAAEVANRLGYPVMLKATAGGGGMGLVVCQDESEVRSSFKRVQERSGALFRNSGVFLERFFPKSHHIEVQVFGNGLGEAISIGERECSIQRRHQKVVEECPSPYIEKRKPQLRKALTECAARFAASVKYASAGTVEYLVDDDTGDFFYLEMNTRLQVEHGITEMCYNVDLVELMYRQVDAQLAGRGGLDASFLEDLQSRTLVPKGHAIELRLCAENPARNYAPSPGLLQAIHWHKKDAGTRIDTWIQPGLTVSANYDSLLAKMMQHSATREDAVRDIIEVASKTIVQGPPNNLELLLAILKSEEFIAGNTITAFLGSFPFAPAAVDVISGGAYTSVQDFPGRPTLGRGFGHAGPMDSVAFRLANKLVGNSDGCEGLEITLTGPELRFLGDAIIAVCGARVDSLTVDGEPVAMWSRIHIRAGQRLAVGRAKAGARCYLAIRGDLPGVAEWFGSKATNPQGAIGGYQNRTLKAGDYLSLQPLEEQHVNGNASSLQIPAEARPSYPEEQDKQKPHWDIRVAGGPYEEGYLSPEDMDMVYTHHWKVSHNAARAGISLVGPKPRWARPDGGDGGSHPSNVIEYGYPLGGLNWTGDDPVILPMDCPDFGGFICSFTVISADLWKVGQLTPGSTVRFHRVSIETALDCRREIEAYLASIGTAIDTGSFTQVRPISGAIPEKDMPARCTDPALIHEIPASSGQPRVTYRQGGDNYLLVQYGTGAFDLNHKSRATALARLLRDPSFSSSISVTNTVGCGTALQIYYDGLAVTQRDLLANLLALETRIGASVTRVANRTFRLPLTFTHPSLTSAIQRYTETQRREAPYLPDPLAFIARNNGMQVEDLKRIFLEAQFVAVGVGFMMALPQCLPADPRHRFASPKMNPSRVFTPGGAVSWGGSCMAIYNADGPGGYMPTGMTLPGADVSGRRKGFSAERPWLYEDMDVLTFYEVSEDEYDKLRAQWEAGEYEWDIRETEFDMAEHNALVEATRDEVAAMKARQKECQKEMLMLEKESLARCRAEEAAGETPAERIEALLQEEGVLPLEAPVSAKVWKVEVAKGDVLKSGTTTVILEAMKLEINVNADKRFEGAVVEEVLVKPGDTVDGGSVVVIARTGSK